MAVTSKYLVVGDRANFRYLVYDKNAKHSGSAALAVIGQNDFVSNQANQGSAGPVANGIGGTGGGGDWNGCAADSAGRLYLADRVNNRVLVYNSVPTSNGVAADFALGQAGLNSNTANSGASGLGWLNGPLGIYARDNQLFVADTGNYRVLVYNLPITANQQPATFVIGQPNSTTVTSGSGAGKFLGLPTAIYSDGSKLFVADYSNRVMVYSPVPTATGALATAVLGQPDFATSGSLGVTNAQQFNGPAYNAGGAVMFITNMDEVAGNLWVPDLNQARIMGFPATSISTYMNATQVIGQSNLTSLATNPAYFTPDGSGFVNLFTPKGILNDPDGSYVWISDQWQHRVVRVKAPAFSTLLH
jgi:hypothetical protein